MPNNNLTCIHPEIIATINEWMCVCPFMSDYLQLYRLAHQLLCPWVFPDKNTGVSCHFLLQGIFLTQGWNLCLLHLLHCRWTLYCLRHWGSPSYHNKFSEYPSSHIDTKLKKQKKISSIWWELLLGFNLLIIFIYNIQ